jgi:phosphoribosylaminoimidazole (AIR) synthetase
VDEDEMFRVFNMGIGMTFVVTPDDISAVKDVLKCLTEVCEIGFIVSGKNKVVLK